MLASRRPQAQGVRLDGDRLRRAIYRRGQRLREFAAEAGITEPTLVAACAGRPVSRRTLLKLSATLDRLPVLDTHGLVADAGAP